MADDETLMDKYMRMLDKISGVLGSADRGDAEAPIVHRHDAFEHASEEELAEFEIEEGSDGTHYCVRKTHHEAA